MHLLRTEQRSLDEAEAAVDLGQTPARILFLSFSDSDLSLVATAAGRRKANAVSLRLANLGMLKHPFSVDLYVEKAASEARFVLIRLLGGLDYWRYGVEELFRAARSQNFALAIVPGDAMEDPRLDTVSTVPGADLRHIHAAFQHGGTEHIAALLDFIESRAGTPHGWREPTALTAIGAAGRFEAARRRLDGSMGHALIVCYRSFMLAGDTAPVGALAEKLAARGLDVSAIFVTSLKDAHVVAWVRAELAREKPDVIINTTGFSARLDTDGGVLDGADAPVLQAIFAGAPEARWRENPRGLGAVDLAMNVVLPEMDGRLITRAIACKAEAGHRADSRIHSPHSRASPFAGEFCRGPCRRLGQIAQDSPRRAQNRLRPFGLSKQARPWRLCRWPRHGEKCLLDCQFDARGRIQHRAAPAHGRIDAPLRRGGFKGAPYTRRLCLGP